MDITKKKLLNLLKSKQSICKISASIDVASDVENDHGMEHVVKVFATGLYNLTVLGNTITFSFGIIGHELGNVDVIKAVDPVLKSSKLLMNGQPDYNITYPTIIDEESQSRSHRVQNLESNELTSVDLIAELERTQNDCELTIEAVVNFRTTSLNNHGDSHVVKLFATDLIDILDSNKDITFHFESSHSDDGNIDVAKASEFVIKSSPAIMAGGLDYKLRYPK